jgi:hypothetical protein
MSSLNDSIKQLQTQRSKIREDLVALSDATSGGIDGDYSFEKEEKMKYADEIMDEQDKQMETQK